MRRAALVCGLVSFLMAFTGTVAALTVVMPATVAAQAAKLTGSSVSVVGDDGVEQVNLTVRPTGGGLIQARDASGNVRAQMGTGGSPPGQPPSATNAGFTVEAADGRTQLGRLGTLTGGAWGVQVSDTTGAGRLDADVAQDGTPSVALRGADGTDRIRMITGPADKSLIAALDANGTQRVELAVGGSNGTLLDAESLNVDDVSHNEIAQLGTSASTPGRGHLRLSDADARPRLVLNVADDGTPSIQMFDAAGNVTWSAQ